MRKEVTYRTPAVHARCFFPGEQSASNTYTYSLSYLLCYTEIPWPHTMVHFATLLRRGMRLAVCVRLGSSWCLVAAVGACVSQMQGTVRGWVDIDTIVCAGRRRFRGRLACHDAGWTLNLGQRGEERVGSTAG